MLTIWRFSCKNLNYQLTYYHTITIDAYGDFCLRWFINDPAVPGFPLFLRQGSHPPPPPNFKLWGGVWLGLKWEQCHILFLYVMFLLKVFLRYKYHTTNCKGGGGGETVMTRCTMWHIDYKKLIQINLNSEQTIEAFSLWYTVLQKRVLSHMAEIS